MLSMLGLNGYTMTAYSNSGFSESSSIMNRNTIVFPEIVIESFDTDVALAMRPVFDALWNTAGYAASPGYDEKGNRRKGRLFDS